MFSGHPFSHKKVSDSYCFFLHLIFCKYCIENKRKILRLLVYACKPTSSACWQQAGEFKPILGYNMSWANLGYTVRHCFKILKGNSVLQQTKLVKNDSICYLLSMIRFRDICFYYHKFDSLSKIRCFDQNSGDIDKYVFKIL